MLATCGEYDLFSYECESGIMYRVIDIGTVRTVQYLRHELDRCGCLKKRGMKRKNQSELKSRCERLRSNSSAPRFRVEQAVYDFSSSVRGSC